MGGILICCVLMAVCPHSVFMYKPRGNKQHTGTSGDILTPGKPWTVHTGISWNTVTPESKSWNMHNSAKNTGTPGNIMTVGSQSWNVPSSAVSLSGSSGDVLTHGKPWTGHAGQSGDIMTVGSMSWNVPSFAKSTKSSGNIMTLGSKFGDVPSSTMSKEPSGDIMTLESGSWNVPSVSAMSTEPSGDIMTSGSKSWDVASSAVRPEPYGNIITPGSKSWDVPSAAETSQGDVKVTTFPAVLMNNFGQTVDTGNTLFDQGKQVSSNLLDSAESGSSASHNQGFDFAREHVPVTSQLSHDMFLKEQRKNALTQQAFGQKHLSLPSFDNLNFNQGKKTMTNANTLDYTERSGGQTGGFDKNNFISLFSSDRQKTFDNKQSNFLDTTFMSGSQFLLSPDYMLQPQQMALTLPSRSPSSIKRPQFMNMKSLSQSQQHAHKCQHHHNRPWLMMVPQSGHIGRWTTGGASTETWTIGSEAGSEHTGGVSSGGSAEGD